MRPRGAMRIAFRVLFSALVYVTSILASAARRIHRSFAQPRDALPRRVVGCVRVHVRSEARPGGEDRQAVGWCSRVVRAAAITRRTLASRHE